MHTFDKKVVVITGAGSGIGQELARQLAMKGARLALSDINVDSLDATMQSLPAGAQARVYQLDTSNRKAVFAHAEQVRHDFGTAHYVINNAGAAILGTIAHLSIEEIEWQLGVNLWGVIYGTKAFMPTFLAQREGCIVNISSVFGMVTAPTQGSYCMSKFAVRALTECLWSELKGTGVRAVCVHPGGIKTNIEAAGRRCANAGAEEAAGEASIRLVLKTPPAQCAADIIRGLEKGDKRIRTGYLSTFLYWLSRLMPNHYHTVINAIS